MKSLYQEAKAIQDQIVADRRYLHQIPEVGMDLPESAAYIEKRLSEMGIPSHRCGVMPDEIRKKYVAMGFPDMAASSGVVATIGSGSPCILLRADFDALPMEEINDLPFCSTRKASHMCGHDTHAAMLLGAAFVVLCDVLARCLFAPFELPVGILLSLIGGPFFLGLLLHGRGRRMYD